MGPSGSSDSSTSKPPSYALGLLFNMFLPGSGFSYLGNWREHLSWLQTFFWVLYVDSYFWHLGAWAWAFPALAWLAMLVHYHVIYGQWKSQGWPLLENATKIVEIVLHLLAVVSFCTVMLAIILPITLKEKISNR